jgi:hypothetical protein
MISACITGALHNVVFVSSVTDTRFLKKIDNHKQYMMRRD